jgi:hypothetical protein
MNTSLSLREKFSSILASICTSESGTIPNAEMFVDQSSIYWMVDFGDEMRYLWIADHSGIDDYIDGDHLIVDAPKAASNEEIGVQGTIWLNVDFNIPFYVSDFERRIETITL